MGVSLLTTVLVSCGTHTILTPYDVDTEWQKLRSIDNPLHPWCELYAEDIPDLQKGERPSVESLDEIFQRARIVAYIGGFVTLVLFVGVVPGVMMSLNVLDKGQFEIWTNVLQFFCFAMAGIVVLVAPIEEIVQICRRMFKNKREKRQANAQNYAYDMPEYDK